MPLVISLALSSASAATLNVPGDHPTVQDAVNAANPEDVIQIAAGSYPDDVIVGKDGVIEVHHSMLD